MEKKICLCMMLKNESHIIKRALDSVKNIVDYYVISDTGSTDNTKEIIKTFFDKLGIEGEIYDHKWVNFGYNRTKLIKTAKNKCDYLLLVDADYVINIHDINFKKKLIHDAYLIGWTGNLDYKNIKLIKSNLEWEYVGPTHEYITCTNKKIDRKYLDKISITEYYDGSNRDDKYERDIRLLLKEIKNKPNDPDIPRYQFYLGRSYEDLGNYELALKHYSKRIELGGWEEEVYYSMYKAGLCLIKLNKSFGEICGQLLEAHELRPHRLEAIFELIKYCRNNNLYNIGYILGKNLINNKYPKKDILFIKKDIYDYKLKDEVSICAYYSGEYLISIQLCSELINSQKVPEYMKRRIRDNMDFSINKIKNQ